MTIEEPLQQTPTHSCAETEGRALGLEVSRARWVILALILGLFPGWLFSGPLGLPWAALIIFGPAVALAAIQLFFFQNMPPGWAFDWMETRLSGAHLSPLENRS